MAKTNITDEAREEKILDRVQKLLNIAEHPNTPAPEAEVALEQANRLITKHAIDEAMFRMTQTTEERRAPEKRTIVLAQGGTGRYIHALRTILQKMAKTYRCTLAMDAYDSKADVYGAAEDVAWVEMLYTSVYFQLLSKINPKWDTSKGYDENVYNFKVAGFKWSEIDAKARENGEADARVWEASRKLKRMEDGTFSSYWTEQIEKGEAKLVSELEDNWVAISQPVYPVKIKGSMIGAYRRHAKLIGDNHPVSTQSHQVYKLSFVEGFKTTMWNRLNEFWLQSQGDMDTIPGAALALVSMDDAIKNMMYSEHPEIDPEEIERRRLAALQERAEMLEKMGPKAAAKFLENEEREYRKRNKPGRVKYYDLDDSASRRGTSAANSVDMNRKAGYAGPAQTRGAIGS